MAQLTTAGKHFELKFESRTLSTEGHAVAQLVEALHYKSEVQLPMVSLWPWDRLSL